MVAFTCLLAQGVCANTEYLEMYTEPPDAKYEVIGEIFDEEPMTDIEYTVVFLVGQKLQRKASSLGANALITGKVERILRVNTKVEDYDLDPFKVIYNLSIYMRINATAIKVEKTK